MPSLNDRVRNAVHKCTALSTDPLISIVIPIFNHFDYLEGCLLSVLQQKGPAFEVICINDCSTDARVSEILDSVSAVNPGLRVVHNATNLGISATQNKAVRIARAPYVAFLDCDDALAPNALVEVNEYIRRNQDGDYFFSDRRSVGEDGNKISDAVYALVRSPRGIVRDLIDRMIASHLKVAKRSSYLRAGGTSELFTGIQDWELALRISRFGKFIYIPQVLYYHRLHKQAHSISTAAFIGKKSNLLRRYYTETIHESRARLREQRISLLERISMDSGQLDTPAKGLFVFSVSQIQKNGWFCPEEVFQANGRGDLLVLDARGSCNEDQISFARDFNSYFDFILVDRASASAAIIGYLWESAILHSPLSDPCRIRIAQSALSANYAAFWTCSNDKALERATNV
jgi:O-antigen biosynthesis protein